MRGAPTRIGIRFYGGGRDAVAASSARKAHWLQGAVPVQKSSYRAMLLNMNRTEAIAIIAAKLAALDDEGVMTVVDIVRDMAEPAAAPLDPPTRSARPSSDRRKTSRLAAPIRATSTAPR